MCAHGALRRCAHSSGSPPVLARVGCPVFWKPQYSPPRPARNVGERGAKAPLLPMPFSMELFNFSAVMRERKCESL